VIIQDAAVLAGPEMTLANTDFYELAQVVVATIIGGRDGRGRRGVTRLVSGEALPDLDVEEVT